MSERSLKSFIDGILAPIIVSIGNAQRQLSNSISGINNSIALKADKIHNHKMRDITDLSRLYNGGNWDVSTNNPALPVASSCPGKFYIVINNGTYAINNVNVSFRENDWILSDGSKWLKIPISENIPPITPNIEATLTTDYTYKVYSEIINSTVAEYVPMTANGRFQELLISNNLLLKTPKLATLSTSGELVLYITATSISNLTFDPVYIGATAVQIMPGKTYEVKLLIRNLSKIYTTVTLR